MIFTTLGRGQGGVVARDGLIELRASAMTNPPGERVFEELTPRHSFRQPVRLLQKLSIDRHRYFRLRAHGGTIYPTRAHLTMAVWNDGVYATAARSS